MDTILRLIQTHQEQAIAIGNGTGGRATEAFIRGLALPSDVPVVMINESGASIYSVFRFTAAPAP